MAITWTHNGSDNKWSVGDTATFTATGDLPDWIKNGEFDAKVYYVTSNGTTDAATATGDGVSYSNNTLTLTMSISMDINDWTVQVFGDNSSNVLRWSGFGAVSALWADPGCQADDAERGDLTHLIVRTYEQQQSDNSWSSVTAIDPSAAGTYRTTYNVTDGYLDATPVTRVVTFPAPIGVANTDFNTPLLPQLPVPGARAHFGGGLMNALHNIFVEDSTSEFVGIGDYPDNTKAFPKAVSKTFDGIAIDAGVRCIMYPSKNFQGTPLIDITGPAIVNNCCARGPLGVAPFDPSGFLSIRDRNLDVFDTLRGDDPQQSGVTIDQLFPSSVRYWSDNLLPDGNHYMQGWSSGSLKLRQVS